jgi:hydrogenase maturation protein HypF
MTLSISGESLRVLAFGAYLKNRACLIEDGKIHWSPLHGDLQDPKACQALVQSIRLMTHNAGGAIDLIAHDMHPDFFSTVLATQLSRSDRVPRIAVQHHHAHIGAVASEYELVGPLLGVALDGSGWGGDHTIWGGELLLVDGFKSHRLGHLQQLALPGGDFASKQSWRMAASALHHLGLGHEIGKRLGDRAGLKNAEMIKFMLDNKLNSPMTSSAGRWFDAVSSLLGFCDDQIFEAQAAQLLEAGAARWLKSNPQSQGSGSARVTNDLVLELGPVITQLLNDYPSEIDRLAAQFHLDLIDGLTAWVMKAKSQYPHINKVCLSGGCFYNAILREGLKSALEAMNLQVYLPSGRQGDCGDSGLALGQAWVGVQYLKIGDTLV